MKYPKWKAAVMFAPVAVRIGYNTGPREPNGCRFWVGGAGKSYYPQIAVDGVLQNVSRVILGLRPGDERVAMHLCDEPRCVEPSHLRVGTQSDNIRDAHAKGRARIPLADQEARRQQTHCKHGHLFDEANTVRRRNGRRDCRACGRDRARHWGQLRKLQKAAALGNLSGQRSPIALSDNGESVTIGGTS